ncbi:hypothetical protein B0O99DRAFT_668603 [Bisporella sp. PMI_857]|nr:hypothetical protein B0O99DRAFT_668603 [Bisporella sp. PMI_857]
MAKTRPTRKRKASKGAGFDSFGMPRPENASIIALRDHISGMKYDHRHVSILASALPISGAPPTVRRLFQPTALRPAVIQPRVLLEDSPEPFPSPVSNPRDGAYIFSSPILVTPQVAANPGRTIITGKDRYGGMDLPWGEEQNEEQQIQRETELRSPSPMYFSDQEAPRESRLPQSSFELVSPSPELEGGLILPSVECCSPFRHATASPELEEEVVRFTSPRSDDRNDELLLSSLRSPSPPYLQSRVGEARSSPHFLWTGVSGSEPDLPALPRNRPTSSTSNGRPVSHSFETVSATSPSSLVFAQRSSISVRPPLVRNPTEQSTGFKERCRILAHLLKTQNDELAPSHTPELAMVTHSNLVIRRFQATIQLLTPVEEIKAETADTAKHRTFGSIRKKGSDKPLVNSLSGWRPGATGNQQLLDGEIWTEAIKEFCSLVGHQLPKHYYDKQWPGQYQGCHVEKRLALMFTLHYCSDPVTGIPNLRMLKELRQRRPKLEAVISMDKAPCLECKEFLAELERFTNIKFALEVMRELGQIEKYRAEPPSIVIKTRLVSGGNKNVLTEKHKSHLDITRSGRVGKPTRGNSKWFSGSESESSSYGRIRRQNSRLVVELPATVRSLSTVNAAPSTNTSNSSSSKTPRAGLFSREHEPFRTSSSSSGADTPTSASSLGFNNLNISLSSSGMETPSSSGYNTPNYGSSRRAASIEDSIFSFEILNKLDKRRGPRGAKRGTTRNPITIDDD